MKKLLFSIFMTFSLGALSATAQTASVNIVPRPASVKMLGGKFKLSAKTQLVATDDNGRRMASFLNDYLLKIYNFKLEYKTAGTPRDKNVIVFAPVAGALYPAENNGSYRLKIDKRRIEIDGFEEGKFYALQSLIQLLPADFKDKAELPAVDIEDKPRFAYRGMHLDVSRHFFSVEFVKKYIDLMAQYKFNYFHWHLTDDQGWRIEIKKYPRLTEVGSKRKESAQGRILNPYVGDGVPVEGFYTQEQIKDVVAYAKARYITVIPEIELPGHSSAALAAYPNLGCKENYEYKVQTTWGIFKEVYCPKEETFQFLEDVLSEVIDLFPDSPYIHVGGDEVLKDFWKDSPLVQELKTKENLKDEHEVQSYFTRRMEKFINSKGKRMIGWDEILEGGLAPNAIVMSWRGMKGGIEAAKAKHDVIMTPTDFAYLDYGQGDPRTEPIHIGGYLNLEKVYSFEPVPKELSEDEKKFILGAQGNVWTEYIQTPEKVEYMTFPRMLALSEVTWSQAENKNFGDFQKRLAYQFARLDKQNVNYRIPEPSGLQNILLTGNQETAEINLTSILSNAKIFYTTDGSEPTEKSAQYLKPFKLTLKPKEKIDLKTIVVNEKGRKSVVYGSTLWRDEMLPPTELKDVEQGVNFRFFQTALTSIDEMDKASGDGAGQTKSLGLGQFKEKLAENLPFAVLFSGYINVPKDEIYEFELEADDSAVLLIDNQIIVNNDSLKDKAERKNGFVPLKKGYHQFALKYFKYQGKWALGLRWGVKGLLLRGVSSNELAYPKMP
ncbi:MAG TPA: family 20 glycosylhydrolase [Pyrinomonadaceae bacterium]|jgi:hexosaminidase